MKSLHACGADVSLVNSEGKTVLDELGNGERLSEVAKLCEQYMCSVVPVLK